MAKFQVGDTVRRTASGFADGRVKRGGEYVVRTVSKSGFWIGLFLEPLHTHDGNDYIASSFELVSRAGDTLLNTNEVVQCILDDIPLECRVKGTTEWRTAYVADSFTVRTIQTYEFRKLVPRKPVMINGIAVPAPMNINGYHGHVYGINMSRKTTYSTKVDHDSGMFWQSPADAQKVLDAMLTLFEGK